jgi:hypothetical protein
MEWMIVGGVLLSCAAIVVGGVIAVVLWLRRR